MQITIVVIGTRGDVQPYIALGLGLQSAGHQIRLAAPVNFKIAVCSRNLDFFPININLQNILETETGHFLLNTQRRFVDLMRGLKTLIKPLVQPALSDMTAACQGAEAVIYSLLAFPTYYIAKELGIPALAACLQPLIRTRAFPSPLLPPLGFRLGSRINWLTHVLVEQIFWHYLRPFVKQWRNQLDLSPVPFWDHFGQLYRQQTPTLCAYSTLVVPKPSDWGENIHVTGYWFLDHQTDWQPPTQLVDFLDSGSPPIGVGFSSMNNGQMEAMLNLIFTSVRQTQQRIVWLKGWSQSVNLPASDDILILNDVPHDWLFPRLSAIIHHGGGGTTAAAIRAGIPSITIPFFFDQAFWGQRIKTLGVGTPPIPLKKLAAPILTQAIETVKTKPFNQQTIALSQHLQTENGVDQAIKALHHHLL